MKKLAELVIAIAVLMIPITGSTQTSDGGASPRRHRAVVRAV